MRITTWNFLHGQVLDPTSTGSEKDALISSLNQLSSEVLALQEVDWGLARTSGSQQIREVAELAGAQWWGFAPTISGTPGVKWRELRRDEEVNHTNEKSGAGEFYGIGIISLIPVKSWERFELGKSPIGAPLAVSNEKGRLRPLYVKDEPRVALAAILENGWTVVNTHLSFVPLFNIFQFIKLTRWVKRLEQRHHTKVILLGDFNLPWGIPEKLSQWRRATQGFSYPSWKPAISFDYIFLRGQDCEYSKEIEIPTLPISDHKPLAIDIS